MSESLRAADPLLALDPSAYASVQSLLTSAEARAEVPLKAVLAGSALGQVWVDDRRRPSMALISVTGSCAYLVGAAGLPGIDARLAASLDTQLHEECRAIGGSYFMATLLDAAWEPVLLRAMARRQPMADDWQYHRFDAAAFRALRPHYRALAPGLRLARIERRQVELLWRELQEFWPSPEAFLAQGLGFCVMTGEQPLSVCFSCYVSAQEHEIAVETFDVNDYRTGLATQACAAYLEAGLLQGLQPQWTAMVSNPASMALARQLGFAPSYRLRGWEFEYADLADSA